MLSASLKAFKKKTKPGPSSLGNSLFYSRGSLFFNRLSRGFAETSEDTPPIDPLIESQIMTITQNFLRANRSRNSHRLSRTVSFASLGLDGFDSIDLVIELEEKLGMMLSQSDARIVNSIQGACLMFTNYSRNTVGRTALGHS